MDVLWLWILGLMLGGWFVLDGANLGLGMSLRRIARTQTQRRLLLTALGPFLLAGEVWLIAAAGLLIGAFPGLESDLLRACYPVVIAIVAAWVLRDVGVWFRSRRPSQAWRRRWELVVVSASTVVSFGWGVLLANVAQGVPHDGSPSIGTLIGPYSLLWGATMVAVFTLHGAAFAALRLPRERREPAARVARRVVVPAAALLGVIAIATPAFSVDLAQPVPALVLQLVAVGAVTMAGRLLGGQHDGRVFACTAVAALVPPIAVGIAVAPRLLEGAADPGTLDLLSSMALPALPVLLAVQAWMWWTFRHRVSTRSAVFF